MSDFHKNNKAQRAYVLRLKLFLNEEIVLVR